MASVTGTGSKAQSKGKAPETTVGITKKSLIEQLRQNKAIFAVQQPVRKELGAQTLEALKTGGVGAKIPLIQRAVEGAQRSNAQALQRTETGLARDSTISGTPFAQSILAQQRQAGAFQASQIPTSIAGQLINTASGGQGGGGFNIPTPNSPTASSGGAQGLGALLGSFFNRK